MAAFLRNQFFTCFHGFHDKIELASWAHAWKVCSTLEHFCTPMRNALSFVIRVKMFQHVRKSKKFPIEFEVVMYHFSFNLLVHERMLKKSYNELCLHRLPIISSWEILKCNFYYVIHINASFIQIKLYMFDWVQFELQSPRLFNSTCKFQ